MAEQPSLLRIHAEDNVAVALRDLTRGELCSGLTVAQPVPAAHKVALNGIPAGAAVIKYGHPIGHTTAPIAPGEWVHEHNLATSLSGAAELRYAPAEAAALSDTAGAFQGYRRADGSVGVRNEIWIAPTVGCINSLAQQLAALGARDLPDGVDGVHALTHPFGCSQLGGDLLRTQRVLAGLVRHPNAGGVLVLGLGCENNTIESFRRALGEVDPARVRFHIAQECGDEVQEGLRLLRGLAERASAARRQKVPLSALTVGLKCGGSDAFSGINANPMVGDVCDRVVGSGGSAVLTEVPEMFGAEHALAARCADREVFDRFAAMIRDFRAYYVHHGQPVSENPSPGNLAGGITTLEEKSLGCVQKGGRAPVVDVLDYGGACAKAGLNLVCGPGNDLVSTTALAAAGAQVILFTTGRGTPMGGPVPTIKVSSRTELARRKPHWIDFDAGRVLAGAGRVLADAERVGLADELFDLTLEVASGRPTRNEENGFRQIALWKDGVTL